MANKGYMKKHRIHANSKIYLITTKQSESSPRIAVLIFGKPPLRNKWLKIGRVLPPTNPPSYTYVNVDESNLRSSNELTSHDDPLIPSGQKEFVKFHLEAINALKKNRQPAPILPDPPMGAPANSKPWEDYAKSVLPFVNATKKWKLGENGPYNCFGCGNSFVTYEEVTEHHKTGCR